VAPGRGAFLVAYLDGAPVACGAVRLLDAAAAEVKRMFVVDEARGRGFGRQMLEALESQARDLGATRLVLETGVRQQEALGLYESAGFTRIDPCGEYVDSPLSVCFGKDL
jgi:GNAT superfamily N-acetyltransferase